MNSMKLSADNLDKMCQKKMLFGDGEEIFGAMVTYWQPYQRITMLCHFRDILGIKWKRK